MWHPLTPAGRLSRWPFFWRVLALYLLAFACYGLPVLAERLHHPAGSWQNLALAGMVACYYLVIAQSIKRLHDLDLRGWWLLLAFVPMVNLGWEPGCSSWRARPAPTASGPPRGGRAQKTSLAGEVFFRIKRLPSGWPGGAGWGCPWADSCSARC